MITWRFASTGDIERYYGKCQRETMKAVAILIDGEPVGIIGMAYERGRMRAFSEFKPQLQPHLKSMPVLRAIKAAQRMYSESKLPVFAVKECDSGILERLGFVQFSDEVYLWHS